MEKKRFSRKQFFLFHTGNLFIDCTVCEWETIASKINIKNEVKSHIFAGNINVVL
jgi:hypothetical protein